MDSIIQTFHIDWKLILAQMVNFLVVVLVLWFFALKPLVQKMTERTQKIEQGLADAQRMAKNVELSEVEKKKIMAEARSEAQAMITKAQATATVTQAAATAETQVKVQKMITDGERRMQQEKEAMLKAVGDEVGALAMAITTKILEQVTDKEVDRAVVKHALKKVKS